MKLAGSTLLIVDDEPVLSFTFGVLLQRAGAKVITAANGHEALALLECKQIDAMLCDKHMPVMDGMTLLRTLYARGLSIPALLFLSTVDPIDPDELERMKVMRTVSKPIKPQALLDAVSSVLAGIPVHSTM